MGSASVVAPGLLVAGPWSLPAKRSRRRHVWLLGGGKAGEDGAGWYQEAGRTTRAKLREEDGAFWFEGCGENPPPPLPMSTFLLRVWGWRGRWGVRSPLPPAVFGVI